ncbi:hypothetical protein E3N88_10403 [Mikania micrantha]|uniref:Uncharacterized protein n=1 Tax=Mikania micrantha TaxID=192012 RepID=A0A5N6PC87_9ASTR|nr:hypothetical protein E3N88_10403 [Mikania micrantha]
MKLIKQVGCGVHACLMFYDSMGIPRGVRKEAFTYICENHKRIWSRCKLGTTAKCDYITKNISEAFNSWIGELRYQPNLGEYEICRSGENRDEVKCMGKLWEVLLDERKCSCWVWQVKAYALEVAPMLAKNRWVHIDTGEKIYPSTIKRPPRRPRNNRILSHDEPKKDTNVHVVVSTDTMQEHARIHHLKILLNLKH